MTTVKIINTTGPDLAQKNIEKYLNDGFVMTHYQHNGFEKYHMVFIKEEKPKENWFTKLFKK